MHGQQNIQIYFATLSGEQIMQDGVKSLEIGC